MATNGNVRIIINGTDINPEHFTDCEVLETKPLPRQLREEDIFGMIGKEMDVDMIELYDYLLNWHWRLGIGTDRKSLVSSWMKEMGDKYKCGISLWDNFATRRTHILTKKI